MAVIDQADYTTLTIPIDKITTAGNVRRQIGDTSDLEASIRAVGLIEPVLVRDLNGSGYQLIAGHRRLTAVTNLGDTEIPARVLPESEDGELARIALQLVENLQRVDLDPVEEAAGYAQLKQYGWKQKEIASNVGRSESHVSKRLALLDLPDQAFDLHQAGTIGPEALYELSRVTSAGGDVGAVIDEINEWTTAENNFRRDPVTLTDVRRLADGAVDDAKAEKEAAARSEELTAEGLHVVLSDVDELPNGHERVGWNLDVDQDEHRKEACAAIHLYVRWGKLHEADVCSDPKRHTPNGDSDLKATVRKPYEPPPAEQKRRKKLEARKKILTTALPLVMGGRTPARDRIVDRMARLYLENVWAEVLKRAIKLLDLDAELDGDYRSLIDLYDNANTAERNRILLAVTAADGHIRATGSYAPEGSDTFERQVKFLSQLGVTVDLEDDE